MTTRTLKASWWTEGPQWLVLLSMFTLAAWTWKDAPDRIPVHWTLAGEVDRYAGKLEGLLLLPAVALAVYLLMLFLPRIDPGRANYATFAGTYIVIRFAVLGLLAALYGWAHLVLRGRAVVETAVIAPLLVGFLYVILGGVMGKVRPNWFVGIRTPWTLSSKQSWVRTHRVAGWLFVISGMTVWGALLVSPVWAERLIPATIALSAGASAAYSYFVWQRDPDKQPPLQTLPLD
jgi:uncharacterized membrane protein